MAREALVLDSNDELTQQLVKILVENGYIVRVLTSKERAKEFEKMPVYIHLLRETHDATIREIDFEKVEIAVFPSPNDTLNLIYAKEAKAQGVPIVIILARSRSVIQQAEELGIIVVPPYHCVLSRMLRVLNLKFTRIVPLRREVALLEMLVTSDSKVLGKKLAELEENIGIKAAVIRKDEYITAGEEEIQEGDYLIAIGLQADLQALID